MANSLLITKLSDDSFSFVVNGDTVNTITNLRNDMTTVGNEAHFKTSNGANLIKLQQILYNEVTIVDGATLPVASNPLDLRVKLRSVGFWDWLTTGGSGVDRFDELADTFEYFGNDGMVPIVDESQLKLIPFQLPDVTYLNLFPSPLQPLQSIRVNSAGTAYEFYPTVNIVTQTITSGNTTTAPSEDAVYQALTTLASSVSPRIPPKTERFGDGITNLFDIGTTALATLILLEGAPLIGDDWVQTGSSIAFGFIPESGKRIQFI
jgi:hypothetical protein